MLLSYSCLALYPPSYFSASDRDKPWRSRKQHHHFNSHLPPLRTVPVDLHPSTVCRNQAWAWLPSPPPPPSLSWCVSQHLRWLLWLFGQHGFHLSSLLPATIPEDHTGIIVAGATGDLGRHGIRVHRHGWGNYSRLLKLWVSFSYHLPAAYVWFSLLSERWHRREGHQEGQARGAGQGIGWSQGILLCIFRTSI